MPLARNIFVTSVGILLGIGLLMVDSASITARPTSFERVYLARQLQFLAVALCLGGAATLFSAEFWKKWAPLFFSVNLLLLIILLFPGVGVRIKGAQRWFRFGSVSLQPSEFAKVTLPLCLCWFVGRVRLWLDELKGRGSTEVSIPPVETAVTVPEQPVLWKSLLRRLWRHPRLRRFMSEMSPFLCLVSPLVLTVMIVAVEPDLGTALFLGMSGLIAIWASGWPGRDFLIGGTLLLPAGLGLIALRPYQLRRIKDFLAVWVDFEKAHYQIKQSLTTLGVGGWTGCGLGSGWQKLSFLPEANTDFVFAVIGEELGLVGTLGVISLWGAVYFSGLKLLAPLPPGSFQQAAGFTLLTQMVLQAALNVAVVTAMAPAKGISHPLISYGGSNLVSSVLALGIFLSLTKEHDPISPSQATPSPM